MTAIYTLVPILIPSWLLWLLMVMAAAQWVVWQWRRIRAEYDALDLGGLVAPLIPWSISYAMIFWDGFAGLPPDIVRGVALSRVSLCWLLVGLNVLLLRPLWRYMNRDR